MSFDAGYFQSVYRDYWRQNPRRKGEYLLREVRNLKPHGRLLDIGCGLGGFLRYAERIYEATGLDTSAYAIEEAAKVCRASRLVEGPLDRFEATQVFDVVTAFDTLEHMTDLEGALSTIRRVLSPDGVLAVLVPVYDGPLGWVVQWLDRDPTHCHKWSRHQWRALLSRSFHTLRTVGILRYLLARQCYFHMAHARLWRIAPAVLFLAQPRPAQTIPASGDRKKGATEAVPAGSLGERGPCGFRSPRGPQIPGTRGGAQPRP